MDEKIFLIIYNLPHGTVLNFLFSIISAVGSYGIIWLVFGIFLKKKLKYYLGFVLLTLLVFSLQNVIGRIRPYEALQGVFYLGFVDPGGYSFPSYHSASSFFGAVFLEEKFKKYKTWLFVLAVLISLSRIYLGAHYLTDVMVGAIIGVVMGVAFVPRKLGTTANRRSPTHGATANRGSPTHGATANRGR